jgi:hypothetical protein
MARRQAWCARCDELRAARAGSRCPTCSSTLLPVPAAERRATPAGWGAVAGARLRALLPAARAVAAGLAVLAVLGGAFTAGRVTRTTPSAGQVAPGATLPTDTTVPAGDQVPLAGGDYQWRSQPRKGLTLTLQRIEVRRRSTVLTVGVDGLRPGQAVVALHGVSVTDRQGHELAPGAPLDAEPAGGSAFGNDVVEVVLPSPVEHLGSVAAMTVRGVTLTDHIAEKARGTLVDRGLRRSESGPVTPPATCKGCRLEVHCASCRTMQVTAWAYRHQDVVVVLAPKGPPSASVLLSGAPQVLASDDATSSDTQPQVNAEPDGTTAVRFPAAAVATGGSGPFRFTLIVEADLGREVSGPWRMRSA